MRHHRLYRIIALISILVWLCSLLPMSVLATPTAYYGDVDRDGVVTTLDARRALNHILGAHTLDDPFQADCVTDGQINSSDVRRILIVVVQKLEPTPYTPRASQYSSEPYRVLNGNEPLFTDAEKTITDTFEIYAPLDALGRCGVAYANLSTALMPDEDRESISSVTPTGWHNQSYSFVSGGWVYNRSHLIGFQLAGEQANAQNLITGTRYLNAEGMLPFENMVADYIRETEHHVLYRVTPIFTKDNLLAEGVTIEAWSIEDNGDGICFYVFCYNVQPGVIFDYTTGENHAADETPDDEDLPDTATFILNTATMKFHQLTCRYVSAISDNNREDYYGARDTLLLEGYTPCGTCKP